MDDIYDQYFYYHDYDMARFNPMELDDHDFEFRYRFTKDNVRNLHSILGDFSEPYDRNIDIDSLSKLCAALRFYATGNLQTTNGDLIGAHQSTISRIVSNVSTVIAQQHKKFIGFSENLSSIKSEFTKRSRIPSVIGAIDGTHIPIISPGGNNA